MYDQVESRAGPLKIYTLPKIHKPIKTQTVNYFDEEAEKQLRAHYERKRDEILQAIHQNQQTKAQAVADIDRRLAELMNQKVNGGPKASMDEDELRRIRAYNLRVNLAGLQNLSIDESQLHRD